MNRISVFLIVSILIISFLLNFYRLGDVPNGFHRDEAFLGYNSFSLLKTGRDMSGNLLPLHLESFLYTPAGYSYLAIPSIMIFGLNEFAVRFPSAVFSVGTSMIIFFLTRKIMTFSKTGFTAGQVETISLLAAFFYAITPWNIMLARTASVITIVVFLIVSGVTVYMYWLETKRKLFLIGSFLLFSMSLGLYIAPYLFLLMFIPFFLIIFYEKIIKREILLNLLCFVVFIVLPFVFTFTSVNLSLRARSLSIANSPHVPLVLAEEIREDGVSHTLLFETRLFHNKVVGFAQYFLDNYFKHFSYSFFFTDEGYPDRYRVPLYGLLYVVQLPLLVIGAYILFRRKRRVAIFLFGWIILSPIGSALASDDIPNLQRTLFMLPPLSILIGVGAISLSHLIKRVLFAKVIVILVSVILLYSFVYYLHQYFVHAERYRPWYRMNGYKELVTKVNQYSLPFEHIVVTNRESAPTIFFLFYNQFDPRVFQEDTKQSKLRDFDRVGFSKYTFSEEECPYKMLEDRKAPVNPGVLYVNSGLCKIPEDSILRKTIRRTDNSIVFYILSKKN